MAGSSKQLLTVTSGGATSTAYNAGNMAAFGLVVPAEFDGTGITFTVSADGTVYQALNEYNTLTNDGVATRAVGLTVAASNSYDLPVALVAWRNWKIVCGTSQTGDTVFTVIGKAP